MQALLLGDGSPLPGRSGKLERLEEIVDRSGVAPRIEPLLPIGVRARQLLVRTLLLGMLLPLLVLLLLGLLATEVAPASEM